MNKRKQGSPLVSVILPVWNKDKYLRQCLDSIFAQGYPNIEVIAVDDGSSDSTPQILAEFANQNSNLQILTHSNNQGVSAAANLAISVAKGVFIARMDADDWMHKDRIEAQVDYLLSNPEVVAVGSHVQLVDEAGLPVRLKKFPIHHQVARKSSYMAMSIQQGAMMVNTNLLPASFNWYDESYQTAEEVELVFKLLQYGEITNLDQVLYFYRQLPNSLSSKNAKQVFANTIKARAQGVKIHGYKPTLSARLIHLAQIMVIALLPTTFIIPTYFALRDLMSKLALADLRFWHWSFFRYAVIGVLTQLIDVGTYALLVQLGVVYFVADFINNPLVLGFNFLGHKYFTFKSLPWQRGELGRYLVNLAVNFVYSTAVLVIAVEVLKLEPIPAKLAQIVAIVLINYLALQKFVFKTRHAPSITQTHSA